MREVRGWSRAWGGCQGSAPEGRMHPAPRAECPARPWERGGELSHPCPAQRDRVCVVKWARVGTASQQLSHSPVPGLEAGERGSKRPGRLLSFHNTPLLWGAEPCSGPGPPAP